MCGFRGGSIFSQGLFLALATIFALLVVASGRIQHDGRRLQALENWDLVESFNVFNSAGHEDFLFDEYFPNFVVADDSIVQIYTYDYGWITTDIDFDTFSVLSVAINSNIVVFGGYDSVSSIYSVQVFTRSGTSWTYDSIISPFTYRDEVILTFGTSVSISPTTDIAAIAATINGSAAALVYDLSTGQRVYDAKIPLTANSTDFTTHVHLIESTLAYDGPNNTIYFVTDYLNSSATSVSLVDNGYLNRGECSMSHFAMRGTIAAASCNNGTKLALWQYLSYSNTWYLIQSLANPINATSHFNVAVNGGRLVLGTTDGYYAYIYSWGAQQVVYTIDLTLESSAPSALYVSIDVNDTVYVVHDKLSRMYIYRVPATSEPTTAPTQPSYTRFVLVGSYALFSNTTEYDIRIKSSRTPSYVCVVSKSSGLAEFVDVTLLPTSIVSRDIVDFPSATIESFDISDYYAVFAVLSGQWGNFSVWTYSRVSGIAGDVWNLLEVFPPLTSYNNASLTMYGRAVATNVYGQIVTIASVYDDDGIDDTYILIYSYSALSNSYISYADYLVENDTLTNLVMSGSTILAISSSKTIYFISCRNNAVVGSCAIDNNWHVQTFSIFSTALQDSVQLGVCDEEFLDLKDNQAILSCYWSSILQLGIFHKIGDDWQLTRVIVRPDVVSNSGTYNPVAIDDVSNVAFMGAVSGSGVHLHLSGLYDSSGTFLQYIDYEDQMEEESSTSVVVAAADQYLFVANEELGMLYAYYDTLLQPTPPPSNNQPSSFFVRRSRKFYVVNQPGAVFYRHTNIEVSTSTLPA